MTFLHVVPACEKPHVLVGSTRELVSGPDQGRNPDVLIDSPIVRESPSK